jgi:hypothetical protein
LQPILFHNFDFALVEIGCREELKFSGTRTWDASQFLYKRKHRVPQGHFENSPAFERRGLTVLQTSPAGTIENGACRVAALAKMGFVSAVPAGLDIFSNYPGIEMPGYSRLFLRNRTPAQKLRCARTRSWQGSLQPVWVLGVSFCIS